MNKEPMSPEDLIAVARQSWVQKNPDLLGEASHKIPFTLLPLILCQALQVCRAEGNRQGHFSRSNNTHSVGRGHSFADKTQEDGD